MAIQAITGAAKLSALPPLEPAKEKFSGILTGGSPPSAAPGARSGTLRLGGEHAGNVSAAGKHRATAGVSLAPSKTGGGPRSAAPVPPPAARAIDQVSRAQSQLDRVLALAQSGRTFTPAQLLALQAQVSQASNELDLAGKVVDKGISGVKQLLTTQI